MPSRILISALLKIKRTLSQFDCSTHYQNYFSELERVRIPIDRLKEVISPFTNIVRILSCSSIKVTHQGYPTTVFWELSVRRSRSKSRNLIGSENGRYFTILSANLGGIVGSFITSLFVVCE